MPLFLLRRRDRGRGGGGAEDRGGLGGRGGVGDVDGVVVAGVAAGEEAEVTENGDRGGGLEAPGIDELADLEAVGEDEVVEVGREGDEGGVGGVGDLDVETPVGKEVGAGEGGDDAGDLQDGGRPVERGTARRGLVGGGVHVLEEAEEDARAQRRHGRRCRRGLTALLQRMGREGARWRQTVSPSLMAGSALVDPMDSSDGWWKKKETTGSISLSYPLFLPYLFYL